MSLLSDAMETFFLYEKTRVQTSWGGFETTWHIGASFQAAAVKETTAEMKVAEAQGVKGLYTITTSRAIKLEYHDVILRDRDKKIFRVTSDGDDVATPKSTVLDMRQVTAEEWELPTNDEVKS